MVEYTAPNQSKIYLSARLAIIDTTMCSFQYKISNNVLNKKLYTHFVTSGPILPVHCVQLLLAIIWPFSKYFQILHIFAQIFKYFALFNIFCPFSENLHPCPYFQEKTLEETPIHILYDCIHVKYLWGRFQAKFQNEIILPSLTLQTAILWLTNETNDSHYLLKHILLFSKCYIILHTKTKTWHGMDTLIATLMRIRKEGNEYALLVTMKQKHATKMVHCRLRFTGDLITHYKKHTGQVGGREFLLDCFACFVCICLLCVIFLVFCCLLFCSLCFREFSSNYYPNTAYHFLFFLLFDQYLYRWFVSFSLSYYRWV